MERHITLLGTLYIIFSALFLIGAVVFFLIITTAGIFSGDETAMFVTGIIGIVISSFLFLVAIPGIIGGIGLLKRKQWARILILIIGILNLLNVPVGTILGIYTIWALTGKQAEAAFNDL